MQTLLKYINNYFSERENLNVFPLVEIGIQNIDSFIVKFMIPIIISRQSEIFHVMSCQYYKLIKVLFLF